ncbi:MAG TPA: peptide MFS transporter [Flavipsychrobacter sp.]
MSVKPTTLEEIQDFKGKYPRQIWYLFLTEMWERFCFYGLRGMLVVFMVTQLMIDEKAANLQYGAIQAFIYAFTFVGGLFADKILGFRKSLFWGGLLMIAGSFIIAASPKDFFYIGTCFTIVGTGFFKPNISTMVGELYRAGDPRRDAGFGLFYSGINIGAMLGGALCVWLGQHENFGWSWAFGSAGVVMILGLLTFIFTQKDLGPIGLSPLQNTAPGKRKTMEIATFIGSLVTIPLLWIMVKETALTDIFMYTIGPVTLIYLGYEMTKVTAAERRKLLAALVFIIFSILFWAFFEQSGGSLSLFALYNLNDKLLGFSVNPNSVNNSANSVFVIIFSIVVGLVWVWMAKKKIEPNSVVKFGLGFLFLAGAFYIFYSTRFFAGPDGKTSLNIFTLAYLVITFGELCLSPIGLSLMTKLAPKKLWGMMMGMWFLASAYGQYVAGLLGAGMASADENASLMTKLISYTDGYKQLGLYALVAGILLIVISPIVRKLMQEVK